MKESSYADAMIGDLCDFCVAHDGFLIQNRLRLMEMSRLRGQR